MILSIILFMLGALANAIQYTAAFRYEQSIFTKWDWFFGERSKRNKYAQDRFGVLIPAPNRWYYRRYKLLYKEKFPLSATLLVFVTDGFHLFQFLRTNFIISSILAYHYTTPDLWTTIWVFITYRIAYSGIFELCYSKLFVGILIKPK